MFNIFIGYDSREAVASDVCAYSIRKRTVSPVKIEYLKHRELRKAGFFVRPWEIDALTGEWRDKIDGRPFSTEFSHTRFLVPALMEYKGWALFMDSDMIFLSDVRKLFDLCDDKYAVMVYKHNHKPDMNEVKMDGRKQTPYHRKNWSSFMLINCGHPGNADLTKERVSFMTGEELHAFTWLRDDEIGNLPNGYNYISGVSPRLPSEMSGRPYVLHYTLGGPWLEGCDKVPYAGLWLDEYENYQTDYEGVISHVPTTVFEGVK